MNKLTGIAYDEKIPLIFDRKTSSNDLIDCYNGTEYCQIDQETRKLMRQLKTPYILVPSDDKDGTKKTLREQWEEFDADAKAMKIRTDGLINMYKSGRDTQTALNLAYHFLNTSKKEVIVPESISIKEATWMRKATYGALIFADEHKGEIFKYDINSSYPSIYSHNNFLIPIKKGEFMKITDEYICDHFKYGIYRAKVEYPSKETKWKKLFKLNSDNHYTHIDLKHARKLNLKITLIIDDNDNHLYYSRDKLKTGSETFKKFVDLLYPLRKFDDTKTRAKSLLRCLWGALSQFNGITLTSDMNDDMDTINTNKEILSINVISSSKIQFVVVPKNKPYETNWARMQPFLLAQGRVKISDFIFPHVDHIYRCHTDSMLSDIELTDLKVSMKLGDMKYEGHYPNGFIKNCNTVIGEFVKAT